MRACFLILSEERMVFDLTALNNIATLEDNSIKQLVFFYELTKMGAVRFDCNNKLHMETLNAMVNKIMELQNKDVSKKPLCVQTIEKQRLQLYELIVFNIMKYSVK